MVRPFRTYAELRDAPPPPLFAVLRILLVIGALFALSATARLAPFELVTGMVSFAWIPLAQAIGVLAATRLVARGVPFRRSYALYIQSIGPMVVLFLALGGLFAFDLDPKRPFQLVLMPGILVATVFSLVLAFALLAMPLLRGRAATARRLVLSIAFVAVLIVPLVPAWRVDAPAYHALVGRSVGERLLLAHRLARRAVAPVGWAPAIARAERLTRRRAIVRVSSHVQAPAVTGIIGPVVLVPSSADAWTDERKLAVLLHELAHVAAHDLVVQVLVATACSLHWFNPLAWLAARRLRLERELAADESVLATGMRASTYAADLLAIAGTAPLGAIGL